MAATWFHRLALTGTVLTLIIVMSGAWVRLTDAGLGCPDWPGCYGQLTPPEAEHEIAAASAEFPHSPVEIGKAWREMIHRYAIPFLGMIVISLAGIAVYARKDPLLPFVAPLLLVPLLVFQALLGMWTVTLLLKPVVVMGHLLGGMTTLALLGWLTLQSRPRPAKFLTAPSGLRTAALVALVVVFAQVALGGWTSANYAGLACPDFPTCQAQWWPAMDFENAFVPWRGLVTDGGADPGSHTAIHMVHRIGALVTALVVGFIALMAALRGRDRATRVSGIAIILILITQIVLGVTVVLKGLPLAPAVAHNGVAALLILATVSLNYAAFRRA